MSYIRDGYVFISQSKKSGRKGYGHVGQCVFLIGQYKFVQFKNITFPSQYWGKRVRLKVEVVDDKNGMPHPKKYSEKDVELIRGLAYQEGYRKGKISVIKYLKKGWKK